MVYNLRYCFILNKCGLVWDIIVYAQNLRACNDVSEFPIVHALTFMVIDIFFCLCELRIKLEKIPEKEVQWY